MVMQYSQSQPDVEDSFEVLTDSSTYAGVIGLMSGAFIGGLLTYIPLTNNSCCFLRFIFIEFI